MKRPSDTTTKNGSSRTRCFGYLKGMKRNTKWLEVHVWKFAAEGYLKLQHIAA